MDVSKLANALCFGLDASRRLVCVIEALDDDYTKRLLATGLILHASSLLGDTGLSRLRNEVQRTTGPAPGMREERPDIQALRDLYAETYQAVRDLLAAHWQESSVSAVLNSWHTIRHSQILPLLEFIEERYDSLCNQAPNLRLPGRRPQHLPDAVAERLSVWRPPVRSEPTRVTITPNHRRIADPGVMSTIPIGSLANYESRLGGLLEDFHTVYTLVEAVAAEPDWEIPLKALTAVVAVSFFDCLEINGWNADRRGRHQSDGYLNLIRQEPFGSGLSADVVTGTLDRPLYDRVLNLRNKVGAHLGRDSMVADLRECTRVVPLSDLTEFMNSLVRAVHGHVIQHAGPRTLTLKLAMSPRVRYEHATPIDAKGAEANY